VRGKPSNPPGNQPIVHKLRGGDIIAWTTGIDAFFGRNRHDNILAACYKVRDAAKDTDPDFFAANFIEGEYTAGNGQRYHRYAVTKTGCVVMLKHVGGVPDKKVLLLAAYDRKAEEVRRRAEPPDLDPAIIPDDPMALEPVKPTIALDLTKEPGGPVEHARRIIEVSGSTETPELMAKILHALPPALEDPEPEPVDDPVVRIDGMRVFTNTRDVAAYFRKRHADVLRAWENLSCSPSFRERNYAFCPYRVEGRSREYPSYDMTKDGMTRLVFSFTGEKAGEFQERYIARFNEMEAALKAQPAPSQPELPRDYLAALKALVMSEEQRAALATTNAAQAQQVAALSAEKTELVSKLEEQGQWVAEFRRLVNADGLILPSDLAKVMHIPQQEFFDRLYKSDYIFQRARPGNRKGRWLAKAAWVKKGLFDHKIYQQPMADGTDKERPQLYVTSKGVEVIAMLFGKDDSGQGRLALGMH